MNNKKPLKVIIYYGYPIAVNNCWNIEEAAQYFSYFDLIVFGDMIATPSHAEYENTREIIDKIYELKPSALIFGYIDIGVRTSNHSIERLRELVDVWSNMKVKGVLLDNAGYIDQTPRARLNDIIDEIHKKGLKVMVNAWYPDEVLSDEINPIYNPNCEKTKLGRDDFYLSESFVVNTVAFAERDGFQPNEDIIIKSEKLVKYRIAKGIKIVGVGIAEFKKLIDIELERYFRFVESLALIYSFDGYGLCDYKYSVESTQIKFFKYTVAPLSFMVDNPLGMIKVSKEQTAWVRENYEFKVYVIIDTNKKRYSYTQTFKKQFISQQKRNIIPRK